MIYELKQKIRYSKWGDATAKWLEKTPVFVPCFVILNWMRFAETPDIVGTSKEETQRYFAENQDKITKVIQNLADETSKKLLLKIINRRESGCFVLKGSPQDQYFPKDIIHLSDEEVFVDCGAYTGDTIAKFRETTKDHYKKIIAFEPDAMCSHKIIEQKIPHCEVLPYGTWDKKDTLTFYANGKGQSCVEDLAQAREDLKKQGKKVTINLEKIDNLPACADMTFLKMDIEGAELNALKGAEQTIRKQRPKLAICIYHSNQDMLEIPLWVLSLNMGYKLYVRHHSHYDLAETVLYAV
ncbi:MAG: FkbM family methyltransferase [Elusimicrobiaceae bacterium]|nr:FkbM family methyltransferase [Elusimicrobiaceae bacterium]